MRINYPKYLLNILLVLLTTNIDAFSTMTTSDGVNLDYEITGEGEPLVMLHSGMMSRDDMQVQVDYFSKFYRVIALDSREQGRSSVTAAQISYQLMSNDVIELLDHLGIKKTNIFGQSDGGITVLVTTLHHFERVSKLIIHGAVFNYKAYPKESRDRWLQYSWSESNPKDIDHDGFPGMAIKSYLLGRKDLSKFAAHLKEMAYMWATSPDLQIEQLSKIQTPILIIVGDHWDISLKHTIEMHEALKHSELFVVPNGTHFIHHKKPDLLHLVMHDFLNK